MQYAFSSTQCSNGQEICSCDNFPPPWYTYILHHHRALYQWWAEYMESLGDMEAALQFYRDGSDHTSIVRIHCFMGNIDLVGVAKCEGVWLV